MLVKRQATKVLLINRDFKPNEYRHQWIANSTVIIAITSFASDKEELPKTGE